MRDLVIGMSDGLTVPFALAAGLSGAVDTTRIIVTAGLAEIAAGAIAMGLGGCLAAQSEAEHYHAERQREVTEVTEKPEAEVTETAIGLQERPRVYHHMIRMDHASRKKLPLDLEWHYTPDHGSWLNVAECELSVLEWQCLARRLPDVETLTREVAAWEHERNQAYVTIDWRLTTADAHIK